MVSHHKAKNIKIIFCCYHVQISLTMSQQTQTDIFHTKMLQSALWCQITWSKCMLCNILEYCSQTLDIHGHRVLQLILFFCLLLYNYWEYVIECVFAVEGHKILKIWLILRIKKISSCSSLSTSNIGYVGIMTGFFSILHIFSGKF